LWRFTGTILGTADAERTSERGARVNVMPQPAATIEDTPVVRL
jgi:hypothetical protein